ncbi:MAG: DUF973 family protein [Zestosphaera sp.]
MKVQPKSPIGPTYMKPALIFSGGVMIVTVGLVLLIISYVGIILLSFEFYDEYDDKLYLIAGILFIFHVVSLIFSLGIATPVLGAVAWALTYSALSNTVRKLRRSQYSSQI